jgi:bacteriophage N4 adsorption protein B
LSPPQWLVAFLAPLAIWILLSGLDDLFVALVWLIPRRKPFPWPAESELDEARERRIAILLPLWNEHRVIGQMLERNLASVRYGSYEIFAGIYPNDEPTARAVAEIARRDPRVHLAPLPHDGPTSKGDCLNWIWLRMREYEARSGVRFEIVVTHDAEDLMHPESLRLVNWFSRDYQMVQIPVLALATGWREFTHGIYCDEFAEFQQKDIPVRQRLGGFLPSNGVGTGFGREALERLAAGRQGRVFDPECLTEDYENCYRIHELGYRQIFVPLPTVREGSRPPVATREYFPRRLRAAVRQRSRWVAGITLQGWQHHGWRAPWRQIYWLWRDRKGLAGNLLSPAANLLFCYGLANWHTLNECPPWLAKCCAAALGISVVQLGSRMWCSARIYGWRFAFTVPLRVWWGTLVNALATIDAIRQFAAARRRKARLSWRKTEHFYPAHATAAMGQQRLGEVLIRLRRLTAVDLNEALCQQPQGIRLGEYLLQIHKLSLEHLYQALSLHAGVELGAPSLAELSVKATRKLPLAAIRRWKVMPYRIDLGQLHLLTPNVPTEGMTRDLAQYCALELRFRLVLPAEFDRLMEQFYGEGVTAAAALPV